MSWMAVIPFKGCAERKTRLRNRLEKTERDYLSQHLFEHVADILHRSPGLSDVALLSDVRPLGWIGRFILDHGRGINVELKAFVKDVRPSGLLVVNADLPFLSVEDIRTLIEIDEEAACSIAPDRKMAGTNALALITPLKFDFAFGPNSFARHMAAARDRVRVITSVGFALDIDTEEDLDTAIVLGFDRCRQNAGARQTTQFEFEWNKSP